VKGGHIVTREHVADINSRLGPDEVGSVETFMDQPQSCSGNKFAAGEEGRRPTGTHINKVVVPNNSRPGGPINCTITSMRADTEAAIARRIAQKIADSVRERRTSLPKLELIGYCHRSVV